MIERRNPLFAVIKNHEQPTVVCSKQTKLPRFIREGQNLVLEEQTNHETTEKPVVCRDISREQGALPNTFLS